MIKFDSSVSIRGMSHWPAQEAATVKVTADAAADLPPRSTPWSRLGSTTDSDPIPVETVCVIGAGSSGLVAAKHLRDAGYTVTVLERTDALGGTFLHKAYVRAGPDEPSAHPRSPAPQRV